MNLTMPHIVICWPQQRKIFWWGAKTLISILSTGSSMLSKSFTDLTQPELSVVILWRIFKDEIAMLPAKSGISSFWTDFSDSFQSQVIGSWLVCLFSFGFYVCTRGPRQLFPRSGHFLLCLQTPWLFFSILTSLFNLTSFPPQPYLFATQPHTSFAATFTVDHRFRNSLSTIFWILLASSRPVTRSLHEYGRKSHNPKNCHRHWLWDNFQRVSIWLLRHIRN